MPPAMSHIFLASPTKLTRTVTASWWGFSPAVQPLLHACSYWNGTKFTERKNML